MFCARRPSYVACSRRDTTPGPELWCRAEARAAATLSCSCRHHERWRRSLRWWALDVPPASPTRAAITKKPPVRVEHKKGSPETRTTRVLCTNAWWWWCGPECRCRISVDNASLNAPNYGGRVPVDTVPGPVPVYRALKNPPRNSSNLSAKTLSMSCNCGETTVFPTRQRACQRPCPDHQELQLSAVSSTTALENSWTCHLHT